MMPNYRSIPSQTWEDLYLAALEAQKNAHAPYSQFPVGSAILADNGDIFAGCNMENASFGATVCAERNAIAHAVVHGHRRFLALCVVTNLNPPAASCGICRQVIAEFCDDIPILLANPQRQWSWTSLPELLPQRFSPSDLIT
jgi:cytidine deaminase